MLGFPVLALALHGTVVVAFTATAAIARMRRGTKVALQVAKKFRKRVIANVGGVATVTSILVCFYASHLQNQFCFICYYCNSR